MIEKFKDNTLIIFVSLSIILLGSIFLSLITPVPGELEKVKEKVHETTIYTIEQFEQNIDDAMWNSIVNRVNQIEIDVNLLKKAISFEEIDAPIVEVIEKQRVGISTITWPPKIKLNFKSPSNEQ